MSAPEKKEVPFRKNSSIDGMSKTQKTKKLTMVSLRCVGHAAADSLCESSMQTKTNDMISKSPKLKALHVEAQKLRMRDIAVSTSAKHRLASLKFVQFLGEEVFEVQSGDKLQWNQAFPCDPTWVLLHLTEMHTSKGGSFPQVKQARAAIKCLHKCVGKNSPTDDQSVCALTAGMHKSHHLHRKPARCPETEEVRKWLMHESEEFVVMRLQSILCIMLGTGMRLEEALRLTPGDVKVLVRGFTAETKKLNIKVKKSKTDVFRQGAEKNSTGETLMKGVVRCMEVAGFGAGEELDSFTMGAPMHRASRRMKVKGKWTTGVIKVRVETVAGVLKVHNASHLTSGVIRENFKHFQSKVTPECPPTTPHASRAFFASALRSSGASELHVKALGGWASSCFLKHLRSFEGEEEQQLQNVHDLTFPNEG